MTAEPQTTDGDRQALAEGVTHLIASFVQRDPATLPEDTRLFADLGMDSTNALELLMRIEDELGISFDADTLLQQHLETIGSLTDYLAAQRGA